MFRRCTAASHFLHRRFCDTDYSTCRAAGGWLCSPAPPLAWPAWALTRVVQSPAQTSCWAHRNSKASPGTPWTLTLTPISWKISLAPIAFGFGRWLTVKFLFGTTYGWWVLALTSDRHSSRLFGWMTSKEKTLISSSFPPNPQSTSPYYLLRTYTPVSIYASTVFKRMPYYCLPHSRTPIS